MNDGILGTGYDSQTKFISPRTVELCRNIATCLGVEKGDVEASSIQVSKRFQTLSFSSHIRDRNDVPVALCKISAYKNGEWHVCIDGIPVAQESQCLSTVQASLNQFFSRRGINLLKWLYDEI